MDTQASPANGRVEWYHPGEVVIVARVRGQLDPAQVHRRLRDRSGDQIPADPASLRSFTFHAPHEPMSLVFFIQQLANTEAVVNVKDIVDSLHGQLGALGSDDMEMLTAMPHCHVKAHEAAFGGSPGSVPVPVTKKPLRDTPGYREYIPRDPALRARASATPIRVAVLDTHWDYATSRRRAEAFRASQNNQQLINTIDALRESMQDVSAYNAEWDSLRPYHSGFAAAAVEPGSYPMPDHGLFIAGLIHSMAPHAKLSYQPVLDDRGAGDLSVLLVGLQNAIAGKTEDEPQIINLSLGFLPHPARLPAAWYGLPRPHDPDYLYSDLLAGGRNQQRWVTTNREDVDRTVHLLQVGLRELARYLRLNNCLVVAAAGNDSLLEAETGHVRMEPRLPARFESVLGVAATTNRPTEPAPYSNLGDERALGDHVATFGGSINDREQPEDGVVGIYAGDFPDGARNETGWAYWSGTSFATGIVSGIAANIWAANPKLSAAEVLAEVHAAAFDSGDYVRELRTPSIAVDGRWRA
jgi:Subtilase family